MRNLLVPIVLLMASASAVSAQAEGSVAVTLEIRGNATTNTPPALTAPMRPDATISSHKAASPTNSAWSLQPSHQAGDTSLFPPAGLAVTCIEVAVCRMGVASDLRGGSGKTSSAPAILIIFPDL